MILAAEKSMKLFEDSKHPDSGPGAVQPEPKLLFSIYDLGSTKLLCPYPVPTSQNDFVSHQLRLHKIISSPISSGSTILRFNTVYKKFVHQRPRWVSSTKNSWGYKSRGTVLKFL